jgi:hypothetical protein
MLLRPHTAPGSETRFQLWGGGDGGFTCGIGPRIRKQRSLRRCLRILASNRVFDAAVFAPVVSARESGSNRACDTTGRVLASNGACDVAVFDVAGEGPDVMYGGVGDDSLAGVTTCDVGPRVRKQRSL